MSDVESTWRRAIRAVGAYISSTHKGERDDVVEVPTDDLELGELYSEANITGVSGRLCCWDVVFGPGVGDGGAQTSISWRASWSLEAVFPVDRLRL